MECSMRPVSPERPPSVIRESLDPELLNGFISRHPSIRHYLIAFSGGLDSSALLDLFARTVHNGSPQITAVHINHGIHPEAGLWARHCEQQASLLGVPFRLVEVDGKHLTGESPEDAARKARYKGLADVMTPGDCLVTAQHQDDQAETMLLQLLRGGGPKGLAAMPGFTEFGPGFMARPLLHTPRHVLLSYANARKLAWLEDPSNLESDYDRNFLRLEVLPILKKRWPALSATLSRSAALCAEAAQHIQAYGYQQLDHLLTSPHRMQIPDLIMLSRENQALVIRAWLEKHTLKMPSHRIISELLDHLIPAPSDKSPIIKWSEAEIRRYGTHLHLLPGGLAPLRSMAEPATCCIPSVLELPGNHGKLELVQQAEDEKNGFQYWQNHHISIRYRKQGDRIRLHNGQHQSLSRLFQACRIPPWYRDDWPLLCKDGEIVTIAQPSARLSDRWPCRQDPLMIWHHPEEAIRFDF